jgi:hypothetical protein
VTELTFTQREIDQLTELLGSLAAQLSESQGTLLRAIFAAGVETVQAAPAPVPPPESTPPDNDDEPPAADDPASPDAQTLRDQLREAFVPGRTPPPSPLVIRVTP